MITINNLNNYLKDGYIVNNVSNFYRDTKPLIRTNDTPLVIGDRWINSASGESWFWNGTYWLSTVLEERNSGQISTSTSQTGPAAILRTMPCFPERIFLEKAIFRTNSTSYTETNYWTITAGYHADIASVFIALGSPVLITANTTTATVSFNTAIITTTKKLVGIEILKIGSPTGGSFNIHYDYRKISP